MFTTSIKIPRHTRALLAIDAVVSVVGSSNESQPEALGHTKGVGVAAVGIRGATLQCSVAFAGGIFDAANEVLVRGGHNHGCVAPAPQSPASPWHGSGSNFV
jgi:hypothetical protein